MSKTVVYFQEGSPAAATVDSHYAYLNQLICLNSNPLSPVIFFFLILALLEGTTLCSFIHMMKI